MSSKCIIIGGGNHNLKLSADIWEDFENRLNHPTQKTKTARKKFFEECEKLFITEDKELVVVETEKLDTGEILKILQG